MKLFDVFDKTGSKIGEIHGERESDDFGCLFGVIIALIVVVGGTVIWPMLFRTAEETGMPPDMWLYFAILLVTDIVICLVGRSWYGHEHLVLLNDIFVKISIIRFVFRERGVE